MTRFIEMVKKSPVKGEFHSFRLKNKDEYSKNSERETVDKFGFGCAGVKISVHIKLKIIGCEPQ